MEARQAAPGAMKLPPGAKERERFNALEAIVKKQGEQLAFLATLVKDQAGMIEQLQAAITEPKPGNKKAKE